MHVSGTLYFKFRSYSYKKIQDTIELPFLLFLVVLYQVLHQHHFLQLFRILLYIFWKKEFYQELFLNGFTQTLPPHSLNGQNPLKCDKSFLLMLQKRIDTLLLTLYLIELTVASLMLKTRVWLIKNITVSPFVSKNGLILLNLCLIQ